MDRVTAFENTLALSITDRRTDGITAELAIRPGLLNTQGVLHGGIIATLADEAAWHALGNHFGRRAEQSTTAELKVNYLRPITGEKVRAVTTLLRAGRTLTVARVDMFDDAGRLGATALVTYMLLSPKS